VKVTDVSEVCTAYILRIAAVRGGLMLLRDVPTPYQSTRRHNPSGTAGDAGYGYRTETGNSNAFVGSSCRGSGGGVV
jgi:hypothetical protein